ncbi:MAG: phosphate ABC transporter permease subunit PstC [Candidatus Sumerlaeia bacterium]|nr:phosphate ABC transporter permease subunit PstC [Candidatus Sumerlaeia bacterium]
MTDSSGNGAGNSPSGGDEQQPKSGNLASLRGRLRKPVPPFRKFREMLVEKVLLVCGLLSTITIALIFIFLFKEGFKAFSDAGITEFLYSVTQQTQYNPATDEIEVTGESIGFVWQPAGTPPRLSILPLLWGSFGVAFLAAIISTLAGIAIGIFLSEMATRRVRDLVKPALELLVGIPTVVIGFFMLAVLARPIRESAGFLGLDGIYRDTYNMMVGALGVSIVIIPVIASLVDDALRAVPKDLRAASLGVGATRWQTTWRVVLPAGVSGVVAAVVLGFGRAFGETMIVLMCAGNAPQMSMNPFEGVRTMTASIAAEMGTAAQGSTWQHTLFLLGAILVSISFVLNLTVEVIANRYRKRIRL